MPLPAGTRFGPYEIVAPIGSGGMGEVYRARDTRLQRDVALKVLPDAFALDAERVARFEREAQLLASLNHPNIAAIYGIEERALVLELVEGPTLADRIARGPILRSEALSIARQIANALEAAHESGIVHRDLKPSNVKLRPDDTVKVLDFGLAKLVEAGAASGAGGIVGLSQSPTITGAEMTRAGVILGTAAYMSPEQAAGKAVDRRADIFAFGGVLYEMLTGRRAFEGDSLSEVLARVLEREPDWSLLPPALPPRVHDLLRRCLEKDPRKRRRDIGDVRVEIEQALLEPARTVAPLVATADSRAGRTRARLWMTVAAALAMATAALGLVHFRETPPDAPEMRLEITTPPTTDPVSIAISPDAQRIVFVATAEGRPRLWLRSLDSASSRPLAGTDGATLPFWSPDSRSAGFFADGKLKRIDTGSGAVQVLADAPSARGGTWNRDDVILFVPSPGGSNAGAILSVSATTGGETATVMRSERSSARFPLFLPDGRHFVYAGIGSLSAGIGGQDETSGVFVGQIGERTTTRILAGGPVLYASSGHLLFVRQGTLFAQAFDPVRLALGGKPFPIADSVGVNPTLPASAFAVSAAGPIIYRTSVAGVRRQLVWFDRSGKETERVGETESDNAAPASPSISPDGKRVVLHRTGPGNFDVWLLEMGRGVLQRFTSDRALDLFPIWAPDGSRVVFSSYRTGSGDLYEMTPAAGPGAERLLFGTPEPETPLDWSRDGRFLLYSRLDPKSESDLWVLPMDGDRQPFPVVQTSFVEENGQFSPDGKWIAYQSNESGRHEVYIQPFPGPGSRQPISANGGVQVRWRRDGKELFYVAPDGRLMAVPMRLAADGTSFEVGAPVPLFATRELGTLQGANRPQYFVSSDGQRFLVNTITEEATSPITVILNLKGPRAPRAD